MSFLRELHQRLNQANSAAGWPAVLDFDDHDEMSNTIATVLSARVSELDSNPLAQALAGEKIREVIRPHDDVEIDLDTRWCTQYDETDLFAARLIASSTALMTLTCGFRCRTSNSGARLQPPISIVKRSARRISNPIAGSSIIPLNGSICNRIRSNAANTWP